MPLDPQTAALLAELATMTHGVVIDEGLGEIGAARAYSAAIFRAFAGPDLAADTVAVDTIMVAGAKGVIPARRYRPVAAGPSVLPVVVFFHGGGWMLGDLDSYDGLMRRLTALSGAQFMSVDYRLAPEYPFPAGLDDAIAATRWIAANADDLNVDPRRLAVMGDSAGGNLAACVCQDAVARGSTAIAAQYLIYPVIDVRPVHAAYPSRMLFGDGDYLLTRDAIDATRTWYLSAGGAPDDPRITPLLTDDLSRLPHSVIITAGYDPLRDEGRAYADRLAAAGVDATYRCFDDTIHAFVSFGVLDRAHDAHRMIAEDIRQTLRTGPPQPTA